MKLFQYIRKKEASENFVTVQRGGTDNENNQKILP